MARSSRGTPILVLVGLPVIAFALAACGGETAGDNDTSAISAIAATPGNAAARDLSSESSGAPYADSKDAGGSVAAPAGTPTDPATLQLDRKIIFTAGISLSVDDVQVRFGDVSRIAAAAGGFVEKSSLDDADSGPVRRATLTLRVPADRYQDTLASLRGLPGATVKNESSKSSEVTDQYTDLQSRLRNLERTEQQYLALLGQAASIQDILLVQDRLDAVRLQIEQIQGRLKVLDDLTDLATIDVTLVPVPAKATEDGGPKSIGAAFADAWDWCIEASRYVLAGAAVLAAAAIFLAVPAGLVTAIAFAVSRRRGPRAA